MPEVHAFGCDQYPPHAMMPRIRPMYSHLKLEFPLVEATQPDHKYRRWHPSNLRQFELDCPAQLEERKLSSDAPDALR